MVQNKSALSEACCAGKIDARTSSFLTHFVVYPPHATHARSHHASIDGPPPPPAVRSLVGHRLSVPPQPELLLLAARVVPRTGRRSHHARIKQLTTERPFCSAKYRHQQEARTRPLRWLPAAVVVPPMPPPAGADTKKRSCCCWWVTDRIRFPLRTCVRAMYHDYDAVLERRRRRRRPRKTHRHLLLLVRRSCVVHLLLVSCVLRREVTRQLISRHHGCDHGPSDGTRVVRRHAARR